MFAKFVTNFLFGFGLRLEALCILKPGRSQRPTFTLLVAIGWPFCWLLPSLADLLAGKRSVASVLVSVSGG